MLENRKFNGVHYSRWIASWKNVGGRYFDEDFEKWLKTFGFSATEIRDVVEMANCGKFELEMSARKFMKGNK